MKLHHLLKHVEYLFAKAIKMKKRLLTEEKWAFLGRHGSEFLGTFASQFRKVLG